MKKLLNGIMGISLLSLFLVMGAAPRAKAQDVSVSYQNFYDELSPYGQWITDPQYGNVWVPNEGGDFRPYGSRGHWVMTDYGNTWVSEDPWGWACYHYGRWTYDGYYGWVWIPGYEWAPAWVSWRYGNDQCGWAPMGPGVTVGMSYNYPSSWWIFVGPQYMYEPNCIHYWRGPSYNDGCLRQTSYVNNYYVDNHTRVRYNYGPRADVIERDTHRPVQVYKVQQSRNPGAPSVSGNRVAMYRPNVDRNSANTARPSNAMAAPRQIGRPQAANNPSAPKAAPFRQQMQNGGARGGQPQPNAPQGGNRPQPNAPQGGNRPQPNAPQGGNRPQPGNNQPHSNPANNKPAPNRPANNNPQPQHNNRFQQQPQPGNNPQQQQPRQQQAPNRPASQQQPLHNNPQPQRQEPMPQQHQQPMPQQRPQPMPQQQQRPQPMQQRPAPAPRQEAPREAPHEGGGGRR